MHNSFNQYILSLHHALMRNSIMSVPLNNLIETFFQSKELCYITTRRPCCIIIIEPTVWFCILRHSVAAAFFLCSAS